MIRTIFMLTFWGLSILIVGPLLLLATLVRRDAKWLYWVTPRIARVGMRLVGVRVEVRGVEHLERGRIYIFMPNHSSNLDPPVLIPAFPGRTSILVKKEVFRIPILGTAMKWAELVPVDRGDREAAIESVNAAIRVMHRGLHMLVFPEGTRTSDGRLLPFKKGPFHLAMDSGTPVVPITVLGTFESWPKTRFALRPGTATVVFHEPIDPQTFPDRESLMQAVRNKIASALPPERRD